MTDGFGFDYDLTGGDFGDEPSHVPAWPEYGALAEAATIPSMWRPFKGGAPITQSFGNRHYGVDFGIPIGTPLYACHAGQVVVARSDTWYGWVVVIKNDSLGVYTVYGHLNYAAGIVVRTGQQVAERQHIGYSGNTGNSTGPHLHLELRTPPYGYPGSCINPLPHLRVWTDAPTEPPDNATRRCRTLRNAPIRRWRNTLSKIGVYPKGAILQVGNDNGTWTWVDGQHGQPSGFVKSAHLEKV